MSEKTSPAAVDARLDPRYPASAVPSITGVGLSPGGAVELVNISKSGVLVEGPIRFVPGTRVTVIFEGSLTPPSHKARVIRCQVSSIVGGALRYHSGIQFDTRLDVLDTVAPAPLPHAPEPAPATDAPQPSPAMRAPAPAPQAAPADHAFRPSHRPATRRPAVNRW